MKIESISTTVLSYERREPMADALNYIPERHAVLVHVETDVGISGLGESAYFGGPPTSTAHVIEHELAPMIIGESAFEIERLWNRMYRQSMQHGRRGIVISALSGIDIALWDALGKALDVPLHRLLGTYRTRLPAYASAGFYRTDQSAEDVADEIEECIRKGFRAVKIKVGRNPALPLDSLNGGADVFGLHGLQQDMERVRSVRQRIGQHVALMVDANSGWDVATALRAMPTLAELNVAWLEEPLFPEDVAGSARLVRSGTIPIAGYETVQGRYGFRNLVSSEAIDIAQPDVTWSGGISECRRIAALAASYDIRCAPHVFGSAVGLAANAHFLASLPNGMILEIDQTENPLRDELVTERLGIDETGMFEVPSGAGLGIELDEDAVSRYQRHNRTGGAIAGSTTESAES